MHPTFNAGVFESGAAAWQRATNILVVRLDGLEGVLTTTPAIDAVKAGGTDSLTLLTSKAGAALKSHLPGVDHLLVYEAPWVWGRLRSGSADRRFLGKLASYRFDAAIIFTATSQSALPAALFCRMAGIPLRLAYSRENPYGLLTDWALQADGLDTGLHADVQRQLDLVRKVGFDAGDASVAFRCDPTDTGVAERKLDETGGNHREAYVVVHPGRTTASPGEAPEWFGRAAQAICERTRTQIVFVGDAGDLDAVVAAQSSMRVSSVSLAGALTVGELASLIRGARAVLCNDNVAAVLAAATQTPRVPIGVEPDAVTEEATV
jgi:ADP-heptose:LPS heptosyltransferase